MNLNAFCLSDGCHGKHVVVLLHLCPHEESIFVQCLPGVVTEVFIIKFKCVFDNTDL